VVVERSDESQTTFFGFPPIRRAVNSRVRRCGEFYMIEAKPENLTGDKAYDSDPLDEQLRREGIESASSPGSNRFVHAIFSGSSSSPPYASSYAIFRVLR
jgi:hypothetical protein